MTQGISRHFFTLPKRRTWHQTFPCIYVFFWTPCNDYQYGNGLTFCIYFLYFTVEVNAMNGDCLIMFYRLEITMYALADIIIQGNDTQIKFIAQGACGNIPTLLVPMTNTLPIDFATVNNFACLMYCQLSYVM